MRNTSPPYPEARDAAEASHAKRLLTVPEAAAMLGIGKRTLQERVTAREITVTKIGKSVRFDIRDLEAFIQSKKIRAVGWKKGGK